MHHTAWPMHKMKKNFLAEMTKADHQLSESFYFIKICFGWVSYKSFPILFGVFLTQKLSLGYSRINPNRRDLEQLGKLLKTTYHHCSTYQYAKAQIKWVKNQKLIRCSNHCFQNWIFSWEFDKEFFSKNWRVKQRNSSNIVFKFKTHYREWSISNVKLRLLCIQRKATKVNSVVNFNSPNIFNWLSYVRF